MVKKPLLPIARRLRWGILVESIFVFFMFILILAYDYLGSHGTIGSIFQILGMIGALGFAVSLIVPSWEDLAALAIGLVFSILALAIFTDMFSPYLTFNAIITMGGIV